MISREEMQEIVRHMCEDAEPDMTAEELQQMLDAELAKDGGEMDMALVKELLLTLEEGATQQEEEEARRRLMKKLGQRRKRPGVVRTLGRVAMIALVILGLATLAYKSAEAFNWEYLQQLFRPAEQTFTTYAGQEPPLAQDGEMRYTNGVKAGEMQTYASPDECPRVVRGFPALPLGMPERITYMTGSAYSDDLSTTVTHVFLDGENTCIFTALILNEPGMTASFHYEKTEADVSEHYVAGCCVKCYFNSDDGTLCAYWTMDRAQYSIFGALTLEEILAVVQQTMMQ